MKRALLNWNTGIKDVPHGPPGYFSKTNWGDYTERHQGRDVLVKRASNLLKLTRKLKPIQWQKIIDSAIEFSKPKKLVDEDVDMITDIGDSSSLVDGDEDLCVENMSPEPIQDEDENGSDIYY